MPAAGHTISSHIRNRFQHFLHKFVLIEKLSESTRIHRFDRVSDDVSISRVITSQQQQRQQIKLRKRHKNFSNANGIDKQRENIESKLISNVTINIHPVTVTDEIAN